MSFIFVTSKFFLYVVVFFLYKSGDSFIFEIRFNRVRKGVFLKLQRYRLVQDFLFDYFKNCGFFVRGLESLFVGFCKVRDNSCMKLFGIQNFFILIDFSLVLIFFLILVSYLFFVFLDVLLVVLGSCISQSQFVGFILFFVYIGRLQRWGQVRRLVEELDRNIKSFEVQELRFLCC